MGIADLRRLSLYDVLMSGGYYEYKDSSLARDIFGWELNLDYGAEGFAESPKAAEINPLQDREISEIVWDVFVLIHSYDWYRSGDTDEAQYGEDIKRFKDKWFKPNKTQIRERTVEQIVKSIQKELEDMG